MCLNDSVRYHPRLRIEAPEEEKAAISDEVIESHYRGSVVHKEVNPGTMIDQIPGKRLRNLPLLFDYLRRWRILNVE